MFTAMQIVHPHAVEGARLGKVGLRVEEQLDLEQRMAGADIPREEILDEISAGELAFDRQRGGPGPGLHVTVGAPQALAVPREEIEVVRSPVTEIERRKRRAAREIERVVSLTEEAGEEALLDRRQGANGNRSR